MKKRLTTAETIAVSSMLFGLFFGAGNLIFPAYMGQAAGGNLVPAIIGFCISGVGLPLLAVAALATTRSNGLQELSSKVSEGYGVFFTGVLYLTIGPLFAIPRCFTVSYETLVAPLVPDGISPHISLLLFTLLFFAALLFFAFRPGKIMVWVGKFLTPLFLVLLAVIMVTALVKPMGSAFAADPIADYATAPLAKGFFEGYNTMDALAGLAFGIVIVNVIHSLGVEKPEDVAACTIRSGIFACALMAFIYAVVTLVGAQSRAVYSTAENGSVSLLEVTRYYFHDAGIYLLGIMMLIACLKTAIGILTSSGETFEKMFPGTLSYNKWIILFGVISFLLANIGLNGIIKFSVPVLMLLYPLAIALIVLALTEKWFYRRTGLYRMVMSVTIIFALFDAIATLPTEVLQAFYWSGFTSMYRKVIPFSGIRMGWLIPMLVVLVVGIIRERRKGPELES